MNRVAKDSQHTEREDEPHRQIKPNRIAQLALRRRLRVRGEDARVGDEDRGVGEPEAAVG